MPTISPDYTKVQELNMIEYESGKRLNLATQANGAPNRPNGEGTLIANTKLTAVFTPSVFVDVPASFQCKKEISQISI